MLVMACPAFNSQASTPALHLHCLCSCTQTEVLAEDLLCAVDEALTALISSGRSFTQVGI